MKDNKKCNITQAVIKCILHIFIEKSHSKFPSHPVKKTVVWEVGGYSQQLFLSYEKTGLSILEIMSIDGKNIP